MKNDTLLLLLLLQELNLEIKTIGVSPRKIV